MQKIGFDNRLEVLEELKQSQIRIAAVMRNMQVIYPTIEKDLKIAIGIINKLIIEEKEMKRIYGSSAFAKLINEERDDNK